MENNWEEIFEKEIFFDIDFFKFFESESFEEAVDKLDWIEEDD